MLPNDSVAVTPGSGVTVATELVGSLEYESQIQAGPSGHLVDSLPTYLAWANDVAFAASKYHLSILNAAGSGKIVRLHKLFASNVRVASVTGVAVRFDYHWITAHSSGTLITPEKFDSTNDALPAGITVRSGATVTAGNRLFGGATTGEEVGATMTLNAGFAMQQALNLLFESSRIQEVVLREGEGFTVKQITSSTAGTYGWLLVFTVE